MADLRLFGSTSNLVRFTLNSKTTGQGLTSLTGSTSGLIISTICDNESAATVYTQAASHIQTLTPGTYSAPSASSCRFGEVDSVNHKGLYEFQFADARFAIANARRLVISVNDAEATILDADYEIALVQFDPYNASTLGLTCLPNAVAGAANGLFIAGTNAATTVNFTGNLSGSVGSVTGAVNSVTGAVGSVTAAVTVGQINAGVITATSIAAAALNGKGDWNTTTPPTTTQIAVAIWEDLTAGGHFGTAGSIGLLAATFMAQTIATPAQLATAIWTDVVASDFTAVGSPGAIIVNLAVPTAIQNATAVWTDSLSGGDFGTANSIGLELSALLTAALTESYAAKGVVPSLAQLLFEIRARLCEASIASSTETVKKIDGVTTAATYTLSDPVNPVSITRAT